jgi:hypothetical protein
MVERIIHSADRLEIIEGLKAVPDRVQAEVEGLPDTVMRFRTGEGEWSIKEVVGHMRDAAEIWHKRLYQVWAQNDPLFTLYDQDALVRERNYQESNTAAVIEEMRGFRKQTVELLAHAVDWSRLGQWPGQGRRSLKQFAEVLLDSENEHLRQIQGLKQAAQASARV